MGAKRFSKYHGKDGNLVFLDDVIKDDDPDMLDDSKLPDDVRKDVDVQFKWDGELQEYVMYTRQKA